MRNFVVSPRNFKEMPNLDNLFDSFFVPNVCGNDQSGFRPAVDISETDSEIFLSVELPGMDKEDIKIWLENETLTISGERKLVRSDEKSDGCIRSEIQSGKFSRSFNLAESIDSEKISADYKNGVLNVTLQKEEKAKPKEIKVNIS